MKFLYSFTPLLLAGVFILFGNLETSAQVSLTFIGCGGVTASIPTSTLTCDDCYDRNPSNGGTKMFVRFDLKRRTSPSGSFSTIQSKWVPDSYSASFIIGSNITSNDYMVEAFTSFPLGNCSAPFTTSPRTCPGGWSSLADSEVFEVGFPTLLVDIIDDEDGNNNGVFCADDISPSNGGVSFQTFTSNADRGWQVIVCRIDEFDNCTIQKGTGWQSGKLPSTFNLLTGLWNTAPNEEWLFWTGKYKVTVAIKSLPCSGWESRVFEFEVKQNGC